MHLSRSHHKESRSKHTQIGLKISHSWFATMVYCNEVSWCHYKARISDYNYSDEAKSGEKECGCFRHETMQESDRVFASYTTYYICEYLCETHWLEHEEQERRSHEAWEQRQEMERQRQEDERKESVAFNDAATHAEAQWRLAQKESLLHTFNQLPAFPLVKDLKSHISTLDFGGDLCIIDRMYHKGSCELVLVCNTPLEVQYAHNNESKIRTHQPRSMHCHLHWTKSKSSKKYVVHATVAT